MSDVEVRELEVYGGVKVPVTVTGEGPPALVLHGGPGPRSVLPIVETLARTHQVFAPTHPGWEGAPRPEWFDTVDDLAIAYLDVLDQLSLDDVLLFGTSLGGWIAAETAIRDRNHRIARLLIVNGAGAAVPGIEVAMPTGGPVAPIPGQALAPTARAEAPPGPSPAAMAAVRAYTRGELTDPKLLRRLAGVRAQTLLIWGSEDRMLPVDYGRAYADSFPNAEFTVIDGGGHLPILERPEATLAAIESFALRSASPV